MILSQDSVKYKRSANSFFQLSTQELQFGSNDSLLSFRKGEPRTPSREEVSVFMCDDICTGLTQPQIPKKRVSPAKSQINFHSTFEKSKASTMASLLSIKRFSKPKRRSRSKKVNERCNSANHEGCTNRFFCWVNCIFCGRFRY